MTFIGAPRWARSARARDGASQARSLLRKRRTDGSAGRVYRTRKDAQTENRGGRLAIASLASRRAGARAAVRGGPGLNATLDRELTNDLSTQDDLPRLLDLDRLGLRFVLRFDFVHVDLRNDSIAQAMPSSRPGKLGRYAARDSRRVRLARNRLLDGQRHAFAPSGRRAPMSAGSSRTVLFSSDAAPA